MSLLNKITHTSPLGRNAFDMSQKRLFTASAGELLPVYCLETVPGDSVEISVNDFLRTQPFNTAAFVRMKQYVHFFFVPYRCLSTKWEKYVMRSPRQESTILSKFSGDGNSPSFLQYKNEFTFPILSTLIRLCTFKDSVSDFWWDKVFSTNWPYSLLDKSISEEVPRAVLASRALKLLDMLEYGIGDIDYSELSSTSQRRYNFWRQNLNGSFSGKTDLVDLDGPPSDADEGYVTNAVVRTRANLFRLLAYNRIYQDFYRDERLESYNSIYSNIDDRNGLADADNIYNNPFFTTILEDNYLPPRFYVRYRNYARDYATSVDLNPFRQDSLLNTLPFDNLNSGGSFFAGASVDGFDGSSVAATSSYQNGNYSASERMYAFYLSNLMSGFPNVSTSSARTTLSAFQMRAAYALERWATRQAHAKSQSYADLVEAHFGVKPSSLDVRFLGGQSAAVVINENISTAATDQAGLGQLSGVGKSSLSDRKIKFSTNEHGIIMGIFSIAPEADYNSYMIDRQNLHTLPEDFFQAEYDGLGYQALSQTEIFNNPLRYLASPLANSDLIPRVPFGFHPIYSEYRSKLDKVHGAFTSNQSLNYWVASRNPFGTSNTIDASFLKVQPLDVDPIFQVSYFSKMENIDTIHDYDINTPSGFAVDEITKGVSINDQFFVNFYTDCKAIRHMSDSGVI